MARMDEEEDIEQELAEEEGVEGEEGEGEEEENPAISGFLTSQTPWWFVSLALHGLVLAFAALVYQTLQDDPLKDVITVTKLEKPPEIKEDEKLKAPNEKELETNHDTPPTDPTSKDASDIVVPPDVQFELSDHFETDNNKDNNTALGNPDAHMFHPNEASEEDAGGGGVEGALMDDAIGVGAGSAGSGGGSGGGQGTGFGVDKGSGSGSFGQRGGGGKRNLIKRHGGSQATEGAVEKGLKWLSLHQEQEGRWDCVKYGGKQADVAVTGMALLAFLGAGHTEKVGKYRDNVRRAVDWIKKQQQPDGSIYKQGDTHGVGYHHAIAGLALAEAAGMGKIADTVKAAEKALEYTTEKHQEGDNSDKKGWRYGPKTPGDMSVSGWFIMQMKSAKMAGVHVNPAGFDGAIKFLDFVEQKGNANDPYSGHRYGYTDNQSIGHRRTAIGCLSRLFLGWKPEDLKGGVDYFLQQGGIPEWDANGGKVDMYYWYYGALVCFQMGGDYWKKWNEAMKNAIVPNQRKGGDEDGSWDPVGAFSEYWGRVGQTALCILCLEVYYRYLKLNDK